MTIISNEIENYDIQRVESIEEIKRVLLFFNSVFNPPLDEVVNNMNDYGIKLLNNAFVYIVQNSQGYLGFVAFYANDINNRTAYLTQIAVHPSAQNRKIAKNLLDLCIEISKERDMQWLKLEVRKYNTRATSFYEKNDFKYMEDASTESFYMIKKL